jgi:hypothetical protein
MTSEKTYGVEFAAGSFANRAVPFEGLPRSGELVHELGVLLALMLAIAVVANILVVG